MNFTHFSSLTKTYSVADYASKVTSLTDSERNQTFELLKILSLCHAIVIDPRTGNYNSSSPDELALV